MDARDQARALIAEAIQGAECGCHENTSDCATRHQADAVLALFDDITTDWGVRGVWPSGGSYLDWRATRAAAERVLAARATLDTPVVSELIWRLVLRTAPQPKEITQ